ncbi:MAG: NUDIX hydrolase [Clostridiaceae bacterium]|nr:NUDIX hydrolase [Clostridiaceae bacterium]
MSEKLQTDFTEKIIASESMFEGRVFDVRVAEVELIDGSESLREIVDHNGGACVVALDSDQTIYFVEQYRISVDEAILEIPAGKIEVGEKHLICAQRELKEEIGITAKRWELLTKFYPTPGYCSEVIHVFLARDLTYGRPNLDPGEFLRVKEYKLDQALKMVINNQIKDSKTMLGILLTVQKIREEVLAESVEPGDDAYGE